MMNQIFTATYQKCPEGYIAWIDEVPGVNTQGKTKREARENLKDALSLVIDANRALARGKKLVNFSKERLKIQLPQTV